MFLLQMLFWCDKHQRRVLRVGQSIIPSPLLACLQGALGEAGRNVIYICKEIILYLQHQGTKHEIHSSVENNILTNLSNHRSIKYQWIVSHMKNVLYLQAIFHYQISQMIFSQKRSKLQLLLERDKLKV